MMNRVMFQSLEQARNLLINQQIELTRQLRGIEKLMPKKRADEDFSLLKQKRKKEGFVYCVRYYVNGKCLPTKFSLKTTDLETAKQKAVSMRDTFLSSYGKGENRNTAFYTLLSNYYAEDSELLAESLRTKRQISQKQIRAYHSFINSYFIPYLKQEGIKNIESLKPQKILEFGGWLRETKKLTAKTINDRINGSIKQALDFLYLKEKIRYNPFNEGVNTNLATIKGEVKRRRIFPVNRLFDVLFSHVFLVLAKTKDGLTNPAEKDIKMKKYLLCLIAATTGLRAGEIFMLKKSSIEKIGGIYFLNIVNSRVDSGNQGLKTQSAYRRVPIHNFVHRAINKYIAFANITGDYLFYSANIHSFKGGVFSVCL